MIQFNAQFDGKNLCPEEPISLPENVLLRVTVTEPPIQGTKSADSVDVFAKLEKQVGLIEGPTDWAAEHDHYLYGVPKNGNRPGE